MKCCVVIAHATCPIHTHTMCVQQIRNYSILPCGSYFSYRKCHKKALSFRYITCGNQLQFLVTR